MRVTQVDHAIELLEKANAGLEPELMSVPEAKAALETYARAQRLAAFGVAALARKIDDAARLAMVTGTSIGRARETIATSKTLEDSKLLGDAMKVGKISLDQATEIARAEDASPGAARELVKLAQHESFHVLKDRARKVKLEAEQHKDLAARQRDARRAGSHVDALGMVHIHMELQPHVGAPIVARAEAEAQRLARAAKKTDRREPFERHLADAYSALLAGAGKGRAKRPELTVLVSHSVIKRGWKDVKPGEFCKIPGLGPVSPQVAKDIAGDAVLNAVFYDGTDLRHFKRWSRDIPVEIRSALELGKPPDFDGIKCVDCGDHFRTEIDHIEPVAAGGPTSLGNGAPRCWPCHRAKTARDRRAGKLKPRAPAAVNSS